VLKKAVLTSLAVLCLAAVGLKLSSTSAKQGVPVVPLASDPLFPVVLGQTVNSVRLLVPPVIDGHTSDWLVGDTIDLNRNTAYSFSGQIDSAGDLSAIIRSGWDEEWLYFLVQVADDQVVADSADVMRDDAVELGLDGLHDQYPWNEDDHQYIIAADGRKFDRNEATTTIAGAVLQYQGGYNVEVAIPIQQLIPGTPVSGTVVGLTVGLRDDDDGGSWDAYLIWQGTNTGAFPEQFASLVFTERSEDRLAVLEGRIAKLEDRIRELLVVLGEFGEVALPTLPPPGPTPIVTRTPTTVPTATPFGAPTPTRTATPPSSSLTPSPTPVATETTITLQQGVNGYFGCEDTYIHLYAPTVNYCTPSLLRVGSKQQYATLVRFNVSALPKNAVVTRAALEVYAVGWGGLDTTLGVNVILRTVTMCEATWEQAQNLNPWAMPGCSSTTTDRRATEESTVSTTGISKWYTFTLTSAVQSWVNGTLPNNGVLLRSLISALDDFLWASADHSDIALRPRLVITYYVPR